MVDVRTVRRRLAELEARGIIARGDQRAVEHLPADKRPIVWDVMIPHVAFADGIEDVNDYRAGKGRGPITPENRPPLTDAPEAKRRADAGKPKADRTSSPVGQAVRPDTGAPDEAGDRTSSPARADLKSDNPPLDHPPTNDHPSFGAAGAAHASKRAHRLPEGWEPDESLKQWFRRQPFARVINPVIETEKFIDWARSANDRVGVKKDWPAAWRNWMRSAAERRTTSHNSPHRPRMDDAYRDRVSGLF